MERKIDWYWLADEERFRGFFTKEPIPAVSQFWAGPFRTYSIAKAHALEYFRARAKISHEIATAIKATRKP